MTSSIVHTVSTWLGTAVLQSLLPMTLIWAALQLVLTFIPRRLLSMRYSVMMMGLMLMTIPSLVIVSQQASVQTKPLRSETNEARSLTFPLFETNPVLKGQVQSEGPSGNIGLEDAKTIVLKLSPKREYIGYLWLVGWAVASSRILLSAKSIRRWSRSAVRCDKDLEITLERILAKMKFRRPVRLLVSKDRIVPMAFGFLQPVIIIPASLVTGMAPYELEAILRHEVAHLIRNDLWHNAFQLLIETFFFYHPCVWLLSRQIRRQREMCCDALAAPSQADRVHLGNALLKLEIQRSQQTLLSTAATGGDTMMRIRYLCNRPETRNSTSSSATLCLLSALLLACLTLLNLPGKSNVIAQQPAPVSASKTIPADMGPGSTEQQTDTKELVGKVVDKMGKPLAGACVFWADFSGYEILTTSEADGRFRIPLLEQDRNRFRFLWVYLPGYNAKAVQPLGGGGIRRDCIVDLELSQSIDIQVLDSEGSPCIGAKVTPYYFEVPNGVFYSDKRTGLIGIVPPGVAKLLSVSTDESGKATLKGLKKSFLKSVTVKSGELAVQDHRGNFNRDQFTIRLAPVATVRGKIDAADLSPLLDGKIRVSTESPNPNANPNDPFSDADFPTTQVECKVAADGTFKAKNMGAGSVSVSFRWDANSPKQLILPAPQKVLPGEEVFVGLETAEAVKIKGKLVTDDTSEPVAQCRVAVVFGNRPRARERISHDLVSDANGEFEAYVLPGDFYVQVFDATKSTATLVAYDYPETLEMTIAGNDEPIVLPPLKFIRLREAAVLVVDTDGQPIVNRLIRRLSAGPSQHTDARGVTDHKGVATVRFNRGSESTDFSGEWIISENNQIGSIKDPRDLPRLKLKQSSPAILQLNK